MSPVPMCPDCRALLGPEERICPYCGLDTERTSLRRSGGPVQRSLHGFGGLVGALLLSNLVIWAATAMVDGRFAAVESDVERGPLDRFVTGLLSPSPRTLLYLGANVPEFVRFGGEWWRLFCPVFLHGGLIHIAFNLMSLREIGELVETAFGTGKALAVYLLAGVAGNLASVGWQMATGPHSVQEIGPIVPRIGASGAILGYVGVLTALGLRIGGPTGRMLWVPFFRATAFLFGLGLLLALLDTPFQFDNTAHAGGFLFGLAAGGLLSFGARSRSSPAVVKAWDATAVVLVILYAAAFVFAILDVAKALR